VARVLPALTLAEAREFVATLASLAGLKVTGGQGQSSSRAQPEPEPDPDPARQ
jgi:hypothetical protein